MDLSLCAISQRESIEYIDRKIEKVFNNCKNKKNPKFFFYINNTFTDETVNRANLQFLEKISQKYSFDINYALVMLKNIHQKMTQCSSTLQNYYNLFICKYFWY